MGEELFEPLAALAASAGKSGCGCRDNAGEGTNMNPDLFASEMDASSTDLAAQLEAALNNLSYEDSKLLSSDALSLEEQLEFAAFGQENSLTLEDLLSFAERNPGLKITFSF